MDKKEQIEKIFTQHHYPDMWPTKNGWYNTSKGNLFWFNEDKNFSCRNDRMSEEYPDFWYEELALSQPKEVALQKPVESDAVEFANWIIARNHPKYSMLDTGEYFWYKDYKADANESYQSTTELYEQFQQLKK